MRPGDVCLFDDISGSAVAIYFGTGLWSGWVQVIIPGVGVQHVSSTSLTLL